MRCGHSTNSLAKQVCSKVLITRARHTHTLMHTRSQGVCVLIKLNLIKFKLQSKVVAVVCHLSQAPHSACNYAALIANDGV